MSTTVQAPPTSPEAPLAPKTVVRRNWKAPIAFGVLTLGLVALVLARPHSGETTFRVASKTDFFTIPQFSVPALTTAWVAIAICALVTVVSLLQARAAKKLSLWLVAGFGIVALAGFLTWAGADGTVPLVGLFAGTLTLAIPLIFGAMCGVVGERVGVVNIAIEGQLLLGAFTGALVGTMTGSVWPGALAAMVAGALVALVLAWFAITYYVDQIIVGVVLNVLILGLTNFLYTEIMSSDIETYNRPPAFPRIPIPLLGDIPLIGPVLFRQPLPVYAMFAMVALLAWGLYRTKWGLRVRAVGEHPQAADTVGINVKRTRYLNVVLAGAIAGAGGATYTLMAVTQFGQEMTGGAGYIALAAVIFGRWDPIRATLAALLFGFTSSLAGLLSVLGSPVPSQFMLMLPYVVTIVAVAGLVGKSRGPAAVGTPYIKG
ncbi:ABC transporter permease [Nocardioides sp. Y6]|uniref:ABC transporter permease n=1 Tax=Nocardioides malaquae TaxID=2773426 RepID=A0ABR9RWG2_9ACTN|nr:ABC transporter permease [Nocardioides malaquae]MBE7325931.1 ABC transporter permease [Nocardioides malaquae]